jgi:hypothetical protein
MPLQSRGRRIYIYIYIYVAVRLCLDQFVHQRRGAKNLDFGRGPLGFSRTRPGLALARLGPAWLVFAWLGSVRLGQARLGSAQPSPVRHGENRLHPARFGSRLGPSAWLRSGWPGSVWLARLGSARLGSARPGPAQLGALFWGAGLRPQSDTPRCRILLSSYVFLKLFDPRSANNKL